MKKSLSMELLNFAYALTLTRSRLGLLRANFFQHNNGLSYPVMIRISFPLNIFITNLENDQI